MPPADRARPPLRPVVRTLPDGRLVIVPPFAAGDRLDGFLQRHGGEADRSRSEWQRLIGAESVLVNGLPARPSQRVVSGDRVLIAEAPRRLDLPPEDDVPFEVIFEDAAMIVVDKPAGVVVHPAPGNERGTLVNGLLARFPDLRDESGNLRPGIVHRLDKDTSGLMVVGRTLAAVADLQRQMQSRTTEKRYLLLVRGGIDEDEGLIDRPIGRDPRNRQRMAVRADGRPAQTHFWVRERLRGWTLVEALLVTGRTHQLRVHFASIGHAVAGDATYGQGAVLPGLRRQFVHSHVLRLRSPHDRREHTFTAPLPADLSAVLERLRRGA
ncbi:MAG TPA: RluA family pseudouridine synthase [Chloroflexota bacterium]